MNAIDGARRGAPARPTVICLHASGGSGTQWKMLADQMRHEFHVLTPDLYGHGMAAMWHGAPADIVAADAARIARLAANVAGDVHLVGHRYGGAIALRIALHHPASVASVAVYEPAALRILFDYNQKYRAAAEIAEVVGNIRHELNGGNAQRAALRFVDYWAGAGHWARLSPRQQHGASPAGHRSSKRTLSHSCTMVFACATMRTSTFRSSISLDATHALRRGGSPSSWNLRCPTSSSRCWTGWGTSDRSPMRSGLRSGLRVCPAADRGAGRGTLQGRVAVWGG